MTPIFLDRTRAGNDPYLHWKVRIFTAGAVLAFAGMYFREDLLIWVAIVVLFLGLALRFLPREEEEGGGEEPHSESRSG